MPKVTLEIITGPTLTTDDEGWEHYAYTVRLEYAGRKMSTPWMQGTGIDHPPTAAAVLESLFMEAAGFDNSRDFEDWANEYGYDTDSRKAERIYEHVRTQTTQLAALITGDRTEIGPWANSWDIEELAREYAGEEQRA